MEPERARPAQNIYWVLPGSFLVGPYPGGPDEGTIVSWLGWLEDQGIRTIIDLTSANERTTRGAQLISYSHLVQAPMTYRRFPVLDGTAPSIAQMRQLLDLIDKCIGSISPVYLHCRGGKFRTRTVIGCYLVRHRFADGANALALDDCLRRSQGAESYELSTDQLELVGRWKPGE